MGSGLPLDQMHEYIQHASDEQMENLVNSQAAHLQRHTKCCPSCDAKRTDALDRALAKMPPDKKALIEAVAQVLAAEMREEVEERDCLDEAFVNALSQHRPEFILDAQERCQKRQDLWAQYRVAFRDGDEREMLRIVEQLREIPLDSSQLYEQR